MKRSYCLVPSHLEAERVSSGSHVFKRKPIIHRRLDLQPPFRSKQEVIINAPLEAVWSFSMDLTKIPEFHPRVVKVDLLSGKTLREPGASYRCYLSGGKHYVHREGHRNYSAAEDRHRVAGGYIRYQQDSPRLQSGNDVPDPWPSVNQGGNQPLLLNDKLESEAPQPNRKRQDRPRHSGNIECRQRQDRGCLS